MVLTDEVKARMRACWAPEGKNAEVYGAETLPRLFASYPATKPNFHRGKKVIDAITEADNNLDEVAGPPSKLSDLHAQKLRVDPVNFKQLSHSFKIIINGGPLKSEIILSLDKFLAQVAKVLVSPYR